MAVLVVVAVIVALGLLWLMAAYNRLVGLRNHIRDAWSDIDTELKRRYDLIPNLVNTVKAHAAHERAVLEAVSELRGKAVGNHGDPASQASDERALVGALQGLLGLVEAYPDLGSDAHFRDLHRQLVLTEDRIQAARRFYNGNVRDYRNACEQFPSRLVASGFGFAAADYFSVAPAVREVPNSDF